MASNLLPTQRDNDSPFQGLKEQPLVPLVRAIQPLLAIVPDIKQMIVIIQQKCTELVDALSSDEVGSILLYTFRSKKSQSSFRSILNKTLRSQVHENIFPWFLYLRLFLSALSKLPSVPFHTVYRGIKDNVLDDYSKDEKTIWWSFISCKSSLQAAEKLFDGNNAKTIFIIECDMAKDVSKYSQDENEILLFPARHFEVISLVEFRNQLNLIQLREIQAEPPLIEIPSVTFIEQSVIESSNQSSSKHRLEYLIDQYSLHAKIHLIEQRIVDDEVPIIVKHAIIKKLCRGLLLSKNLITASGLSSLVTELKENKTLEFLSLSHNHLGDRGAKSLANILSVNTCHLSILSLHGTRLTDEGVQSLCDMLKKNTSLTWLHIGQNKISDQGVKQLTNTLTNHNNVLEALDLSKNKLITDSSIDYIDQMFKENNTLNTLWINHCDLSSKGKNRLEHVVNSYKHYFVLTV